jgi:hypothetical protein
VLCTHPLDQGDILSDFLEWNFELGVDFVLVQDLGSTDGTHDALDKFARTGRLAWFVLPERNMLKYKPDQALAQMARDQYGADWIIMCDVDEFLCPRSEDLHSALEKAQEDDITVVNVPCFNMIGPVLKPGERALETLTLRIDRPIQETAQQQGTGDITVPYTFIRHPPKTIVHASTFVDYVPGTHGATSSRGKTAELSGLHFKHYLMRDFDRFEKKIQNAAAWLSDNPHLPSWWGWHWRRWIRLNQEGRLREEYENQFVSPARAQELIRDGICQMDEIVSSWIRSR